MVLPSPSRALAVVFALLAQLAAGADVENFIVIIDCGSTGSRAHVFTYPPRLQFANFTTWKRNIISGSPVSFPKPILEFKSTPGISSFADRPEEAARGLKRIVDSAARAIRKRSPHADLIDVPVYLGATAGMRVLSSAKRDAIMAEVRGFLGGHHCPFAFSRPEQARVLSGEEEGAFGWLAANHKMGTLSSDPTMTFGALDMGGASTQISFIPYETSVLAHMFPIHIGYFRNGPIHLYTHSFLRFGYAAAFRSSALLASIGSSTFEHPCLPRGLVWYVNEGEFGIGGDGRPERDNGPVTMSGGGNFWECQTLARSLMIQSYCTTLPCALLGIYLPALQNSSFLAFSEFKKNFDRMNITADTVAPPLKALAARLATWCSMTHERQAAIADEQLGTWKAHIELSCWLGTWILELLTTGLGFPSDTRNIKLFGSEFDIGWAQGQAIYETSYFPYKVVEATRRRRRKERDGEVEVEEEEVRDLSADSQAWWRLAAAGPGAGSAAALGQGRAPSAVGAAAEDSSSPSALRAGGPKALGSLAALPSAASLATAAAALLALGVVIGRALEQRRGGSRLGASTGALLG